LKKRYLRLNSERQVFIREDSKKTLENVKRLIFDFDGVVVQTRESLRKNVVRVVDYYFHDMLGLEDGKDDGLVSFGDIEDFKATGMFNNDWNLTYAFLLHYLAVLVKLIEVKSALAEFSSRYRTYRFKDLQATVHSLGEMGRYISDLGINLYQLTSEKSGIRSGLSSFVSRSRGGDRAATEENIQSFLPNPQKPLLGLLKEMVPYRDEGDDVVKRLFEESYLGSQLFQRFHGAKPFFNFKRGFIHLETFIPTSETLRTLKARFGPLLIYSERSRSQGLYHLRRYNATKFFSEDGMVFVDEILELEKRLSRNLGGSHVYLGKPDPTAFLNLIKRTGNADSVVGYVGDTVADALLVENARRMGGKDLAFIGLLCSSYNPDRLVKKYKALGADVIVSDVNDLPSIFAFLGG